MSSLRAVNSSAAPVLFYGCSISLWQLKENGGGTECPFSLSTLQGFRGNVITFASFPRHAVMWHAPLCGRWDEAIEASTYHKKRKFSSAGKYLCFSSSESALLPKSKVERIVNLDFFPWKIQAVQSHCFFIHGNQIYFSPLTPPCHEPSMQTLGQQWRSQSLLFQM